MEGYKTEHRRPLSSGEGVDAFILKSPSPLHLEPPGSRNGGEAGRGRRRGQGLPGRQGRSNGPCSSKILYLGSPQRSNPYFLSGHEHWWAFSLKFKRCNKKNPFQVREATSASAVKMLGWGKRKTLLMSVPFSVSKMDSSPSPLLPLVSLLSPRRSAATNGPREEGGRKGRGGPAPHVTPRGANVRS